MARSYAWSAAARSELGKQPGTSRPVRLIFAEPCVLSQLVEGSQSIGSATRLCNRDCAIDCNDWRSRHRQQNVVQLCDRIPVRFATPASYGMRRLYRGFELVPADLGERTRAKQKRVGFCDHVLVPRTRILARQRHVLAARAAPRTATRMRVQHQGQQAKRLGLVRKKRGDEAAQPDCLFGKVAPPGFGAGGIGPAFRICGINGIEHRSEPGAKLIPVRNPKRDPRDFDLVLRPDEALPHRRRRDEERGRNRGGIEAENGLQHERSANAAFNRRMRAGKHQGKTLVRNPILPLDVHCGDLRQELQMIGRPVGSLPLARGINLLPTRDREEPAFRVRGNALFWPVDQRGGKRFRQRVFRAGHVSRAGREESYELPVAFPRHTLEHHSFAQIGRSSTVPWLAPGHRAAQEIAASRSGASITK